MPILNRLISLYETRGIGISTGLSAWRHANLPLVTFTWFMRGGESITDGLGIALQEIYFLECLFDRYRPKSIFVIGNSWGWSTLGLSLINPQARVVAIDAGLGQNSLEGLDFTNRVAHEEKLNLIAVKASSPHDVSGVLAKEFAGPVDFAFIDGYHTEQQVALDFAAIRPSAAADAVYLFHDVLRWRPASRAPPRRSTCHGSPSRAQRRAWRSCSTRLATRTSLRRSRHSAPAMRRKRSWIAKSTKSRIAAG